MGLLPTATVMCAIYFCLPLTYPSLPSIYLRTAALGGVCCWLTSTECLGQHPFVGMPAELCVGQHTIELLTECGMSEREIGKLLDEDAVMVAETDRPSLL